MKIDISLLGLACAVLITAVGVVILNANGIEHNKFSYLLGWLACVFYYLGKKLQKEG